MTVSRWRDAQKTRWLADLADVLDLCFPDWQHRSRVRLLFTARQAGSVIAACDKPTLTIGLFLRAIPLGRFARQATLIHECCHLVTEGRHGATWKTAMRRASKCVAAAGRKRLGRILQRDIGLYRKRKVSRSAILNQLEHVVRFGKRSDYHWTLEVISDWAGWPANDFVQLHPWLHGEWKKRSGSRHR